LIFKQYDTYNIVILEHLWGK